LKIIEQIIEEEELLKNQILIVKLGKEHAIDKNLTGLVATKIANQFQKPTMILNETRNENDELLWAGSGRIFSQSNFTTFKEFLEYSEYFEFAQGHQGAFGCAIKAENVEITKKLDAAVADISKLSTDKLDADAADIKYATIDKLNATDADIRDLEATYGEFEKLTTDKFTAVDADISKLEADNVQINQKLVTAEADIDKLQTDKLDASTADIKYATIENLNATNADIDNLEQVFIVTAYGQE
jgi:single-stranded DNA-specific DHH superfamily exonuclease